MTSPPPRRALLAFASVSFMYYAYAGLSGTYLPLWFAALGYGTLAIGALVSLQSATRLFAPYAWGWLADHSGARSRLLRITAALSMVFALGYFASPSYGWMAGVTVGLFVCAGGVVPISEAALAQFVSRGGAFDVVRYGRVRMWGSIGCIVAVGGGGALLQATGVGAFPWFIALLLAGLLVAALRLPDTQEPHAPVAPGVATPGVLAVLRRPVVAWFFAGVFFTVLAHTSVYAFFSLYLVALGYSKTAIGLIWAIAVVAEVGWFWFQGRWLGRLSSHAWLTVVALVAVLRFAVTARFGAVPAVLVAAQCSHALTFAAQHSACVAVLSRHFPGRLRGRGQALYTVLGYGASGVVGGLAGGALSEAYGFAAVFWAASGAALLGAACAACAGALERASDAAARPLTPATAGAASAPGVTS